MLWLVAQVCLMLCDPMDCSPPVSDFRQLTFLGNPGEAWFEIHGVDLWLAQICSAHRIHQVGPGQHFLVLMSYPSLVVFPPKPGVGSLLPDATFQSQATDGARFYEPQHCAGNCSGCLSLTLHPDQFSSVAQLCLTFCNHMDCSTPGFPVLHYLPEFAQTHVH